MDSLKRAMRWDEKAFGREYDLDIFMIVAVSDFNMGAMENKGLNVFNDKYVLASPETATDADYEGIEAVIAHEYFHNWTGNRITCRDWFQLCLKEGLTVFRDQEFSADERSRPVERIGDVRGLRAHQFVEDAGPLAHPVRPALYHEINNFYTATVYEKGAEVVRMLRTLLGPDDFRKGMDLYFSRHDGEAATVEQFVQCFADVSGRDLTQFMLWYSQAGTPEVVASGRYDARAKTYRLEIAQTVPPTPGQPNKEPMVIPLAIGLVGRDGRDLPLKLADGESLERGVLCLTKPAETFVFDDIDEAPVPSLNRGFSAPVKLVVNLSGDDLRFLAAHDRDPFNRWQAVQTLASRLLVDNVAALRAGAAHRQDRGPARCARRHPRRRCARTRLRGACADHAGRSRHRARDRPRRRSRCDLRGALRRCARPSASISARALAERYRQLDDRGPYQSRRRERRPALAAQLCLDLMAATGRPDAIAPPREQYRDRRQHDRPHGGAVDARRSATYPERAAALDDFFARYTRRSADRRQVVHAAGHDPGARDARPREGAHHASGVLVCQSQSRARPDPCVRDGEPEGIQPRRRRGLRFHRRDRAGARSEKSAARGAAVVGAQELARARDRPAGAGTRRRCGAWRTRRRCRPTWATSCAAHVGD